MRNEEVALGKFKHIVVTSRDYPRDYLDIKYNRKVVIMKRTAQRQAIAFQVTSLVGTAQFRGTHAIFFQIKLVRRDLQALHDSVQGQILNSSSKGTRQTTEIAMNFYHLLSHVGTKFPLLVFVFFSQQSFTELVIRQNLFQPSS